MSPLGLSAIAYVARLRWPVFPLKPSSKVPHGALVPRGVLEATLDASQVKEWWKRAPDANVGLACGFGFFVLDVDPRNGGDDTLGELQRTHGPLPDTVMGLTGGGGLHYLFATTEGKLKGSAGEGLDVKGPGGYIVAPPSIHPDGGVYRWDAGLHPLETPVAAAPSWLLHLLVKRDVQRDPSRVLGTAAQSFLAQCFDVAGWLGNEVDSVRVMARCPWIDDHSADRGGHRTGDGGDTSCVLFAATKDSPLGTFHCSHGHCAGRGTVEALRALPTPAVRVVAREHQNLARLAIRLLIRVGGRTRS
jgi:hypothetical protein